MTPHDLTIRLAAQAAAAGDHAGALGLLDTLEDDEGIRLARGLRAKILAQLRRYDEAIALWEAVLQNEPDNADAREGLEAARRCKEGKLLPGTVAWRVACAAAAGLLLFGAAAFALGRLSRGGPTREMTARLEALAGGMETLRQGLDAARKDGEKAFAGVDLAVDGLRQGQGALAATLEKAGQDAAALRGLLDAGLGETRAALAAQDAAQAQRLQEAREGDLAAVSARMDQLERALAERLDGAAAAAQARLDGDVVPRLAALAQALEQGLAALEGRADAAAGAAELEAETLRGTFAAAAEQQRAGQEETRAALAALRKDLLAVLALSSEVRSLTEACDAINESFWGGTKEERDMLRLRLRALQERAEAFQP